MDIFFILLGKIIPLYLLIALGFVAGRWLKVGKESVAIMLIYVVAPAVVFQAVLLTELTPSLLLLPVIFFGASIILCLIGYVVAGWMFKDGRKNILAFMAGTGNTGYFGLPVAIAIFGPSIQGLVILGNMGLLFYEASLGYFMVARGNFSARQSVLKALRLPTLYAFLAALLLNILGVRLSGTLLDLATNFRGAYTILGMMMIGLGLSGLTTFRLDLPFLSVAFVMKFLAWPLLMVGVVMADRTLLHFFSNQVHQILLLQSIVPIAANSVAYATDLKVEPEKAATAVLLSTVFALVFIPAMVAAFN